MKKSIKRTEVLERARYGLMVVGLFAVMALAFSTGTWAVELTADEHTVALWHFNEGSGNIVYDESGNDNHGTIHGATWATGMFGPALQFDGVDDYVEVPASASLDITDAITLEAWIYMTGWSEVGSPIHNVILAKRIRTANYQYHVKKVTGQEYGYLGWYSSATKDSTSGTKLYLNNWYHVAAILDDTNNILKFYVNGQLSYENAASTVTLSTNNAPLTIGTDNYLIMTMFNGTVDEIRISNVARTAEEIAESASRNKQPIADAGNDQVIFINEGVTLDGTNSYDPEGTPLTYTWYEDEEIIATEPTVTLTYTEADIGIHYYQLVVNDGELDSEPDTVTIGVAGEGRPKPNMTFRLKHMSINWKEHPRLKTHGRLRFELELPEDYDYQSMDPDAETIITVEIPTQDGEYAVGQDRITFREYRNYWLYHLLPAHPPKPPKPHGRR